MRIRDWSSDVCSSDLARIIAVNTLVVMEIFHLFFIRNLYGTFLTWKAVRGTKVVWMTVVVVTFAPFAITYAPPLQRVFATKQIPVMAGQIGRTSSRERVCKYVYIPRIPTTSKKK